MVEHVPSPHSSRRPGDPRRAPAGYWLGAIALAAVLLLVAPTYRWVHGDDIYPGVRVGGVHVGGREARAAVERLAEAGVDPGAPVTVRAGDREWTLQPGESGLAFDANATATAAWEVGRLGARPRAVWDMLAARFQGRQVAPIVAFDEARARAALAGIAAELDRPALNASVMVEGTAVRTTPAEPGQRLDVEPSLATLRTAAESGVWPVRGVALAVETLPPEVTDASPAVAAAQTLLAEPVALRADDQVWPLDPRELAPMLTTHIADGRVRLDLDRERFKGWMTPVTAAISRTAEMPRFHFDDETGALALVRGGREGRLIDLEETARRILAAGEGGERLVRVAVTTVPPAVGDGATAEELGIRELVRAETSRFAGSAPERIHNVALAASKFDGLLIPPDGVFSFSEHIGDITVETGYKKALIIMDGATRDGVGGGVCQVSTTLFRTAFWSGLPIVERTAHGYRVPYYEQGAPVGFDATVFTPVVDLKFKNDTGAWLLIESETNTRRTTTTFRFYGTKPGREVAMEGPVIGRSVPPPAPRVEVDPGLAPGQSKIIEHARNGASVSLTRVIREPGKEEVREVYRSNYVPTGQVTAVGPGGDQPPPPEGADAAAQTTQSTGEGAGPP